MTSILRFFATFFVGFVLVTAPPVAEANVWDGEALLDLRTPVTMPGGLSILQSSGVVRGDTTTVAFRGIQNTCYRTVLDLPMTRFIIGSLDYDGLSTFAALLSDPTGVLWTNVQYEMGGGGGNAGALSLRDRVNPASPAMIGAIASLASTQVSVGDRIRDFIRRVPLLIVVLGFGVQLALIAWERLTKGGVRKEHLLAFLVRGAATGLFLYYFLPLAAWAITLFNYLTVMIAPLSAQESAMNAIVVSNLTGTISSGTLVNLITVGFQFIALLSMRVIFILRDLLMAVTLCLGPISVAVGFVRSSFGGEGDFLGRYAQEFFTGFIRLLFWGPVAAVVLLGLSSITYTTSLGMTSTMQSVAYGMAAYFMAKTIPQIANNLGGAAMSGGMSLMAPLAGAVMGWGAFGVPLKGLGLGLSSLGEKLGLDISGVAGKGGENALRNLASTVAPVTDSARAMKNALDTPLLSGTSPDQGIKVSASTMDPVQIGSVPDSALSLAKDGVADKTSLGMAGNTESNVDGAFSTSKSTADDMGLSTGNILAQDDGTASSLLDVPLAGASDAVAAGSQAGGDVEALARILDLGRSGTVSKDSLREALSSGSIRFEDGTWTTPAHVLAAQGELSREDAAALGVLGARDSGGISVGDLFSPASKAVAARGGQHGGPVSSRTPRGRGPEDVRLVSTGVELSSDNDGAYDTSPMAPAESLPLETSGEIVRIGSGGGAGPLSGAVLPPVLYEIKGPDRVEHEGTPAAPAEMSQSAPRFVYTPGEIIKITGTGGDGGSPTGNPETVILPPEGIRTVTTPIGGGGYREVIQNVLRGGSDAVSVVGEQAAEEATRAVQRNVAESGSTPGSGSTL
jgi:hypothetical protein